MPKETPSYRGKVKVAIKKGNAVIKRSNHNAGLPDMAMLFAKALTGSLDLSTDVPRILDIGYKVKRTESATEALDNGLWNSILNHTVPIGGRQFKYDSDLRNWVGILTTTVFATDLNSALIDNVQENVRLGEYDLKIKLGSYKRGDRHWFAEVDIDNDFIDGLKESTSAIITWYCELLYNEDMSSTTDTSVINTERSDDTIVDEATEVVEEVTEEE